MRLGVELTITTRGNEDRSTLDDGVDDLDEVLDAILQFFGDDLDEMGRAILTELPEGSAEESKRTIATVCPLAELSVPLPAWLRRRSDGHVPRRNACAPCRGTLEAMQSQIILPTLCPPEAGPDAGEVERVTGWKNGGEGES